MKKIIYLLLSVILILSLVACGNQHNEDVAGSTDIANDTEIVYVPEFVELEGAESIGWSNMRFVGDGKQRAVNDHHKRRGSGFFSGAEVCG